MNKITLDDVVDTFHIKYSSELSDLISDIQYDLNKQGIPLLNRYSTSMSDDFIQFIMYNVNLNKIYT